MRLTTRVFWALELIAFLFMASGCASSRLTPTIEELERPGTGLTSESGQSISGYRLVGEGLVEYKGRARLVEPDSIAIWRTERADAQDDDEMIQKVRVDGPTFHLSQIKDLEVYSTNPGGTVGLLVLGGVAIFAVLFATADFEPAN